MPEIRVGWRARWSNGRGHLVDLADSFIAGTEDLDPTDHSTAVAQIRGEIAGGLRPGTLATSGKAPHRQSDRTTELDSLTRSFMWMYVLARAKMRSGQWLCAWISVGWR